MNSANANNQQERDARTEPESITQGVADVMNAFFDIGASLTKSVAQATANNKPVPGPAPAAAPLNVIIHYGLITVRNVFNIFAGGITNRAATSPGDATTPSADTASSAPRPKTTDNGGFTGAASLPVVRRGGTLRMPLSIENPGEEPMQQMRFLCLAMRGDTAAVGKQLDVSAVRFQPEVLSIEPRDFEKLTLFIDTGIDTSPGRYEAVIGLGDGGFQMKVEFEVLQQGI